MKNILRLLRLFQPYTAWLLLGILTSLITLLSNITLMAISGWFIASMAIAGAAGVSMNYFSPAAMIRASAIFRTAGRYAERLITHEATFRLLSKLRVWFYRHLEPLVPAAVEDMRSGDLLSRIGADIDTLDNFYIRVMVPVSVAAVGTVLTTWVISRYDSTLATILFAMLLLAGVALPLLITALGRRPGAAVVEQSALLRTQIVDTIQGIAELTACGALPANASQVVDTDRKLHKAQKQLSRASGLAQSGSLLITHLAMWLIVFTAIPLVSLTLIEPAELAMLTLFTLAAFDAVIPLPDAFRLLGQVQQAATRLFAIVDRRPATTEPAVEAKPPASFDILLHQVSMQYRDEGPAVLKAVDLTIRQGSKLAIVGPTGAGKSSLIQLLLHYRDPSSGRISLGDRPISDYTQAQLHQWIAVVPQQIHLFNTTIRHNLLIAKPDASQQELEAACRHARIHDFIRQQPDGYDTWTGETGIKLSGGQARRIAIARALLRDFKLLVLDEPGESLDAGTEKAVINELVDIPGNRSLLMITHSHTGLDLMDEIKVLERGSLIDYRLYSARYNAASTIFTC